VADRFEMYCTDQNRREFAFKWLLKRRDDNGGNAPKSTYLLPWEMLSAEDFRATIDLKLERYILIRVVDYVNRRPIEH
jgi:hypothetical protein